MSDMPAVDRRSFDNEFRERLTRVEVNVSSANSEVVQLRQRVHEMASTLTSVVVMQEEAKEARAELSRKIDSLSNRLEPVLVTHAQIASTVASHVSQCHEHTQQTDNKLDRLEREGQERHLENVKNLSEFRQAFFEKMNKTDKRLGWYAGIAMGIGIAVSAIINHGALLHKIIG